MKAIQTPESNNKASGPKGFEFVETIPYQRESIILGKSMVLAHTMTYELDDAEIEAIKNGHKHIVVTCIGFLPVIAVGLTKADLDEFRDDCLRHQNKKPQ